MNNQIALRRMHIINKIVTNYVYIKIKLLFYSYITIPSYYRLKDLV